MAGMSDFLEGQIRGHQFRTATWAKPTVLAVSLHTSDPGNDVTASWAATEVANAGAYARVARAPLDANWSPGTATDGATDNVAAVTFPVPTGNWGVVTHAALWDSAAYGGGNLIWSGPLAVSKTINSGDAAPSFAAGTLDVVIG